LGRGGAGPRRGMGDLDGSKNAGEVEVLQADDVGSECTRVWGREMMDGAASRYGSD